MQIDDDEEREELMSFVGTRVDFTKRFSWKGEAAGNELLASFEESLALPRCVG